MSFVAIIGAGAIGGSLAHKLAGRDRVGEVRLIDTDVMIAEAMALDILQSSPVDGFGTRVTASPSLMSSAGADAIVMADAASGKGEHEGEAGLSLLRQIAAIEGRSPIVFAAAPHRIGADRTRVGAPRACGPGAGWVRSGSVVASRGRSAEGGGDRLGGGDGFRPADRLRTATASAVRLQRAHPRSLAARTLRARLRRSPRDRRDRHGSAGALLVLRGLASQQGRCSARGTRSRWHQSRASARPYPPGAHAVRKCGRTGLTSDSRSRAEQRSFHHREETEKTEKA
jgi:hypothetical protein